MYAAKFTSTLDQLFQTKMMPLSGDSFEFMQNLNKGREWSEKNETGKIILANELQMVT